MNECMTFPSPALCLHLTQHAGDVAVSLSSFASLYGSGPQKDLVHRCAWFKPLSSLPSPDLDTCMIVRAWSKNPGLRSRCSCPALASISQPSKLYLFAPETAQLFRSPPLTPSLPWSPSPPNAHSIENLYPKTSFVGPAFIEKVSYAGMGTIRETRTGAQSHQVQHPSYGLNE